MLATDPRSFHEPFVFSQSTLPSFLCSHHLLLPVTRSPHALFPGWLYVPCSELRFLSACDSVFTLRAFLCASELAPFVLLPRFSGCSFSAMRFSSYWDVRSISGGTLSLNSFLFPPLIPHSPLPIRPLWISDQAVLTDVCCLLSCARAAFAALFISCILHVPCSCLRSPQLPSAFAASAWNPLPLCFPFLPKGPPNPSPPAHYLSFPFISPWNSSSWVSFPFMMQRTQEQFAQMYLFCILRAIHVF